MSNIKRITGKLIREEDVFHIKCLDGHVMPYAAEAVLSKKGVYCSYPGCNMQIHLSDNDETLAMRRPALFCDKIIAIIRNSGFRRG